MHWLTFRVQYAPGFRFNLTDLLFILLVAALSGWLYLRVPTSSLYGIPLYLLLSFFLYCNVFRIGNLLEALWYLPFAGMAVYTLSRGDFPQFWWWVLWVLEPWKWVLIAYRIWRGPYQGAGYRQVAAWRGQRLDPPAP